MYWEQEAALIVSDLHFGKTGHFRKSGFAIPQAVYKEDLQRLLAQIQHFKPRQLIIVGDLFHSEENRELELFKKWRADFNGLELHLVRGNHDILQDSWYREAKISVHENYLELGEFIFIHDIADANDESAEINRDSYIFSGHIHPGIRINGAGKQSLCFPCFYFGKRFAVLPAFSRFTGVALIDPQEDENVFALIPNSTRRKEKSTIIQIQ
jgi:DNA ligase-associated metallophosphoesterase